MTTNELLDRALNDNGGRFALYVNGPCDCGESHPCTAQFFWQDAGDHETAVGCGSTLALAVQAALDATPEVDFA
jgi:hypothetical protein